MIAGGCRWRNSVGRSPALREDARELAGRLRRASVPRVYAESRLDDGSPISLAGSADGFRIADPLRRFYGQSNPRAALWSFVRAVERA